MAALEQYLMQNALYFAQQLRQQPLSTLLRHSFEIIQLQAIVNEVALFASSQSKANTGIFNATGQASLQTTQSASYMDILSAANDRVPILRTAKNSGFGKQTWLYGNERAAHVSNIFQLTRTRSSARTEVQDRILLICSCLSLALDFQQFEKERQLHSTIEILLDTVFEGNDPGWQEISRRMNSFVSSQQVSHSSKEKLEAGLRLGVKLQVVEHMGKTLNLGSALAICLGFECDQLSRLSYEELPAIRSQLQDPANDWSAIRDFSRTSSEWWSESLARYHSAHSSWRRSQRGAAVPRMHPSYISSDQEKVAKYSPPTPRPSISSTSAEALRFKATGAAGVAASNPDVPMITQPDSGQSDQAADRSLKRRWSSRNDGAGAGASSAQVADYDPATLFDSLPSSGM